MYEVTVTNTGSFTVIEADGNDRRSRGARIAAAVRRMKAAGLTVEKVSVRYDEAQGFLSRTTARYRVTAAPTAADKLLAEIEERQVWSRGDGLFLPEGYSSETLNELWFAGRIVPGSKTSGPGGKLGWYSVRMIDADHAEALALNA